MKRSVFRSLLLLAAAGILLCAAPTVAVAQDGATNASESNRQEKPASWLASPVTVFSQPGVRFMHKLRSTCEGSTISVSGLPDGLAYNATRQLVEGKVEAEGKYNYDVHIASGGKTCTETVSLTVSKNLPSPVPFMGWISWNSVQDEISESVVRQITDLFHEKGLYDCGWNTIVLDDWWHAKSRAADGKPRPDPTRFPGGIESASNYVHNAGMKFGIYTDAATLTCAGAFGSYGYEEIDAKQYYDWGVDLVKADYCNAPEDVDSAKVRYKALADAFRDAGGRTLLYICEWGVREPWKWGAEAGGICWRVSYDVRDCWRGANGGIGVLQSIEVMKNLSAWQGVNRFNDADMLCTGLHGKGKSSNELCATGPGMTQDEYRTQFSLWCMWSSPLSLTFDPRSPYLTDDDFKIMTSRELIALNQDPMGQQADLISENDDFVVFAKDCENGDVAVSVTNLGETTRSATISLSDIPALDPKKTYTVRDCWEEADLDDVGTGSLTAVVRSHATRVFRLAEKGL